MALGGIDPLFSIYSRITDNLMYLDERYILSFSVQLMKKNPNGDPIFFHSEYKYFNQGFDQDTVTIKRNFQYYLVIEDREDYKKSIYIRPRDLPSLKYLFENKIMPWFIGNSTVYTMREGQLELAMNDQVQFPLSEVVMLIFAPMIIEYSDGATKEGCRIYINDYNNYINLGLDRFMEFAYYICNVDYYLAAQNMLNYVKTQPYGVNQKEASSFGNRKSFYDK